MALAELGERVDEVRTMQQAVGLQQVAITDRQKELVAHRENAMQELGNLEKAVEVAKGGAGPEKARLLGERVTALDSELARGRRD